ncbi:MAG TPA: hypothetical protein ACFYD6_00515 [Candidatus Brocadiia bacterium]|nr:hypothetical protein [Candidatus Brocadiales bacterium]
MVASFIPSILDELDDVVITSPLAGRVIRHDGTKWVDAILAHSDLSDIGTNTHAQIDTHIADTSDPHGATLTQTNLNLTGTFDISNTAPAITLTDTTASAKSLKIDVDADKAQIREKAGASNSLMTFDLANNKIGIVKDPTGTEKLQIFGAGSGNILRLFDLTISEASPSRWISFKLNSTVTGNPCAIDFDPQPPDNSSSLFRFFRNVNTTASVYFQVLIGDGTSTVNHTFYGKGGDSYVCANNGNFGIKTTTPDTRLDIEDGAISFKGMTAPGNPVSDKVALYVTASGTTPNRTVALKCKFQDGTETMLASVLV